VEGREHVFSQWPNRYAHVQSMDAVDEPNAPSPTLARGPPPVRRMCAHTHPTDGIHPVRGGGVRTFSPPCQEEKPGWSTLAETLGRTLRIAAAAAAKDLAMAEDSVRECEGV